MKTMGAIRMKTQFLLLLSLLLPALSHAAAMNDYCVVPAFIGENVPANLLLMIDNSSSMYDLTYSDQGQTGQCSVTTLQACQRSADCPILSGTTHESCVNGRAPYYCFDETYKANVCSGDSTITCGTDSECASGQTCKNIYAGYFSSTSFYTYDLTNKYFEPGTYVAANCSKSLSNTLCVGIDGTNTVNYFGASGNYLNWLASSKFDVEKQILTGGKDVGSLCSGTDRACNSNGDCVTGTCTAVATSFLQSESRGCLGQGFAKIALTSNFANYAATSTDPNSQLGIVFLIKGPRDSDNPSAPSRGGQTYIEIYNAAGTTFNSQACQQAIDAWASGDKQGMATNSATCIGYNPSATAPNKCYANSALTCPNNTAEECIVTASMGSCDNPAGQACMTNSDCPVPQVPGVCSNDATKTCSADPQCGVTITPGNCGAGNPKAGQVCSTNNDCMDGGTLGTCANDTALTCSQASDCTIATVNGTCSAGANTGGACASPADCPTAAVNGTCSAGTNVGGACTSSANCPTAAVNGTCSNQSLSCTPSTNCDSAEVLGACQVSGTSCSANSNCAPYCSNNHNKTCTPVGSACSGSNGACVSDTCVGYKPATTGTCQNYTAPGTAACTGYTAPSTAPCTGYSAGSTGNCNDYVAGTTGSCDGVLTTQNTCAGFIPATTGACAGAVQAGDFGPCVNPAQSLVVKTKTAYTHTINTCSAYLAKLPDETGLGNGDVTTFENGGDCVAIYSAKACSNAPTQGCANDGDCTSPGTCVVGPGVCLADNNKPCVADTNCAAGTCTKGPGAILAGNAAMICSSAYLGAYYTGSAPGWGKNDWSSDMAGQVTAFKAYCSAAQPTVIDPTSAVSTGAGSYSETPAMLGTMGVEGQLGSPIGTLPVRLKIAPQACTSNDDCTGNTICSSGACVPSGLIQQFGDRIRIGAMTFNFNGSSTEAGATGTGIVTPQCCSNDTSKLCTLAADCGGNTCGGSYCTNLDGGQVLYPVGLGSCATMTTTQCSAGNPCGSGTCINGFCGTMKATTCATDAACISGDICISRGVGDHNSGLINTLDRIRANAWTPFAEAFYNAIGYFAVQMVCDNSITTQCKTDSDCGGGNHCSVSSGKSRTDLRINSGDYNENLNPSQYPCQQNYVLLITDGSSTADRNPFVAGLATPNSVLSSTTAGQCSYFAGSTYLPTLSWLSRHRNISSFLPPAGSPPTAPIATVEAAQGRDSVTTYVVATGGSNGLTGECNSVQLLTDTAANGGSTIKQANNPQDLSKSLQSVFEELAAKSASGTAASILSNSEGSGANILQAIFFPRKIFDNQTEARWLGELNNLWYYVDPFIGKSSTRENTIDGGTTKALHLKNDYVLQFGFDNVKGATNVKILADTDGNGAGDTNPGCVGVDPRCVTNPYPNSDPDPNAVYLNSPDSIKSLWKAGKQLYERDLTNASDPNGGPRTIYTPCAGGGTCISGTGLMKFNFGTYPPSGITVTTTPDNSAALQTNLQYPADNAGAQKLMKYVHGFDYPGDTSWRSRTVQIGSIPSSTFSTNPASLYVTNPKNKGIGVWKLGDIISSTPRVQSSIRQNGYNLPKPSGYGDTSYGDEAGKTGYISTSDYKGRGKVYVGGNDGMLHAFNLGILNVDALGNQKATLDGTGLGNEAWAFIPQSVLPYLKYYADPDYTHLYFMDGSTALVDASVGHPATPACDAGTAYWDCLKDKLSGTGSNWRTILVGGMGIGGASRDADDNTCVAGPGGSCVKTPIHGIGYSSYYALDVTIPNSPKFLWEFSDGGLGFATSGAAIMKISATTTTDGVTSPDKNKNGRWFAVFGSGPMGPIDTTNHRFMGTSSQRLKVYVVDLNPTAPFVLNTNYWVLEDVYTGVDSVTSVLDVLTPAPLEHAFAGSLVNGAIDADRWNSSAAGNYQDDAVYFGYSQEAKKVDNTWAGTWTKGGVLKLVTNHNLDPATWKLVKVIDDIGPVTTGISRLQDRKEHKLWLYFGTGRYFYLRDDFNTGIGERIYGVQDLCYRDGIDRTGGSTGAITPKDSLDPLCARKTTGLVDQTDPNPTQGMSKGWFIPLDLQHPTDPDPKKILGGERVITDPVAMTNGAVFFSTYKPNNDFCQYGGVSYMWAVKYDTGTAAPAAALQGKALVQVSTGQFNEIDLASAFTDKGNRRMSDQNAMTGKPPTDPPPLVSRGNNKPVKRILHIQER